MNPIYSPKPVGTVLLNAATNNIATNAWTIVTTKVVKAASKIQIFNTTGSTLAISTGTPGNESANLLPYTILQGISSDLIIIDVPSGSPLTVMALDAVSAQGLLVINLFG